MQATQTTVGNGQRAVTPVTPERQRKEKTPKSMTPKLAPEMAKATKLKQSESDIDVPELVESICAAKASVGQTFHGRKAGQPINAAVAAKAKVLLGLEPSQHLSDKLWKAIQAETEKFLEKRLAEAVDNYPEIVSIRLNVPTAKIDAKTNKAKDFLWQSRVARAREAANYGDERVGINMLLRSAQDRLEYMTGKRKVNGKFVQPTKTYTREEIEVIENRVNALQARANELTKLIGKAKGNGKPTK